MMIAKSVRKLEGYVPGEQPKNRNVIKLNTNENPYPPSHKCAEVLKNFDLDDLRRYPDPDCTELKAALAKLNGTTPDRIFVGNGSDEILALAARAFVENDEAIGSLDPSYSLYKTLAAIRDVKWVGNRTDGKVALFLWTNPNAPTGTLAARDFVAKTAKSFKGVMLVDEAYADFSRDNCMALATAPGNRNVIVMRTFSKSFSLAGLRVGYCVGPKPLIEALVKVKDSYNVDAIAQKVAVAAVKDVKWMRANVKKVVATRTKVAEAMRLRGWTVNESESNFLFARPPAGIEAEAVFRELRRRNIFVRWWGIKNVRDFIRVTIGTDGQMQAFLRELERICRR